MRSDPIITDPLAPNCTLTRVSPILSESAAITPPPLIEGATPYGGLVLATDGNFYGLTAAGGNGGVGTLYRITPTGTLTTLANFTLNTNGGQPQDTPIQGADGNLYAVNESGGASGAGTVFRFGISGSVLSVVHNFFGADGTEPYGGLAQGADGSLYGTTPTGGANGQGVIYRVFLSDGTLVNVHSFAVDEGTQPHSSLVLATDGNFYGGNSSKIFRITPAGVFSILSDSFGSSAALSLGTDGFLYGVSSAQTIFKMSVGGAITSLANLSDIGATARFAPLVQAADGNFYGTSEGNGTNSAGTVYKCTPLGALTILHSFDTVPDGEVPTAGLALASDGSLYGTASAGGAHGLGTVFKITTSGAFTTLHSFTGA